MQPSKDVAQWLAEARAGSIDALGMALEACRGYLLKVARRNFDRALKAKAGVAELVQETFLEAQRDFARFYGHTEREWLAWLRQLLLHNLANFGRSFRAAKREIGCETSLHKKGLSTHLQLGLATQDASPMDQAIAREQAELVQQSLRRLPREYRRALLLRYHDQLDFREIGERTGRSENAVRKLFARAVERMHEELEDSL
jgi:RNA polymerase sigma-70 factor (ECF subfamily)